MSKLCKFFKQNAKVSYCAAQKYIYLRLNVQFKQKYRALTRFSVHLPTQEKYLNYERMAPLGNFYSL